MKILQKIWIKVRAIWTKKDVIIRKWAPIAIDVVEGLKKVMDGPYDDIALAILQHAAPGAPALISAKIKTAIEKYLPTALLNLNMINAIANITDPTEQLKAILEQFKMSDDELKSKGYHDFSVLVLYSLADGKLTWGECVMIAEDYYETFVKPRENGTN